MHGGSIMKNLNMKEKLLTIAIWVIVAIIVAIIIFIVKLVFDGVMASDLPNWLKWMILR